MNLRPTCYPPRVPPKSRDWGVYCAGYNAPEFTSSVVEQNAENLSSGNQWADAPDVPREIIGSRLSFWDVSKGKWHAPCTVRQIHGIHYERKAKRYKFPGGRSGLAGRGLLGRFGPNHAADPIQVVTRFKKGKLQVVLVRRTDGSNQLAFPGGMVDPGDTHSQTLKKEFSEEAARPGGA
eukprot:2029201-Prymnesium_polylepis.2